MFCAIVYWHRPTAVQDLQLPAQIEASSSGETNKIERSLPRDEIIVNTYIWREVSVEYNKTVWLENT